MSEQQILLADDGTQKFAGGPHSTFISNVLKSSTSNIGIFVNRGFGGPSLDATTSRPGQVSRAASTMSIRSSHGAPTIPIADRSHHLFFPYFGGEDDRLALRFVLQLARNERVTATIVHIDHPLLPDQLSDSSATPQAEGSRDAASSEQEKISNTTFFNSIRDSLPATLASSVMFLTQTLTVGDGSGAVDPVAAAVDSARGEVCRSRNNAGDLVVVGRNSLGQLADSGSGVSEDELGSEAKRSFGVVGEAMVSKSNGVRASVLVVQAVG